MSTQALQQRKEIYRKTFEHKKILVTGGLGFIGSNLARALVSAGADVLLVDSMIPDYGGNLFNIDSFRSQVAVNNTDVRDTAEIERVVRGQDFLFNLAGQVSHIESMEDPMTDLEINCRSQLSILEACRKINPEVRIVYASTRQIYGRPAVLPAKEDHPIRPTDVNGINKASGEMYHQLYHEVYDLRTTSLRLTNTYGPRQLVKHNRQGFTGWFIRRVVLGEEILLFGNGQQKRDFNYVEDVVHAFLLAAASSVAEGEIFNLGTKKPTTLRDFVELLFEVSEREPNYRLVPFPEERQRIDIGDFYTDYGKIEKTLGWAPETSLREGLTKTVEYYVKNIAQYLN